MALPKYVTAITSVASSVYVTKLPQYAYSAETTIDGNSISARAPNGTCRRSDTFAAHSGRIRSNPAAKTTRVEERNSVPAHPRNQAPKASTMIADIAELWR